MKTILTVNDITKRFKWKYAVKSLCFSVKEGEVFALLGSNGAGKTTTIKMIRGLMNPDS